MGRGPFISIKITSLLAFGALLLVGYTNCGLPYRADSSLASSASVDGGTHTVCDNDLESTFGGSYKTLLVSNCASCHNDGGAAGLPFASSNATTAFTTFMKVTETAVAANAVDATHAPGHTGPALQAAVTTAHATWMPAYEAYSSCLSSGNGGVTTALDMDEQNLPSLYFSGASTVTGSWDLGSQASPQSARFPAKFAVDIKVAYAPNQDGISVPVGYTFTNPRVKMQNGDQEAVISKLIVRINGVRVPGADAWMAASATARKVIDVPIYTGTITTTQQIVSDADRISFSFVSLTVRARTDNPAGIADPVITSSLPQDGGVSIAKDATIPVSITNDTIETTSPLQSKAVRWCLTTKPDRPTSALVCPGYEKMSSSGWSTTRPSAYNLADMGALPDEGIVTKLYVWVANSDYRLNANAQSLSFKRDITPPMFPANYDFSVSPGTNQIANASVPAVSGATGYCIVESSSTSLLASTGCASYSATPPTWFLMGAAGLRYVKVVIRDAAGNTSATTTQLPNVKTITNTFGRMTYYQLIASSGDEGAVFKNQCASCHASGQGGNAKFKVALSTDSQTVKDAAWADAVNQKTSVQKDAGIVPGATASHSGVSLSAREKSLLNLWFVQQSGTPPEL